MTELINSFGSRSILYYPTIEFQTETWVKASLLFWDKIYRIVPTHYRTNDSDEIKIAISNGFIEDIEQPMTSDKQQTNLKVFAIN